MDSGRQYSPVELISRFTVSITSTKASFFLYFTSDLLHDVFPVAWMVILEESSRCAYIGAQTKREKISSGEGPGEEQRRSRSFDGIESNERINSPQTAPT